MKRINEMTESEILALKPYDLELMLKYECAIAGIKLVKQPVEPEYFKVESTNKRIYTIDFFDGKLGFEDISELNKVISVIQECRTATAYDSKYVGDKYVSILSGIVEGRYGRNWKEISSSDCYSKELYEIVKSDLETNQKLKKQYDAAKKEYNDFIDSVSDIKKMIYDTYNSVVAKDLEKKNLLMIFKRDYFPVSEGNYDIAIKYMDLAYSLTDEQKDYIKTEFLI